MNGSSDSNQSRLYSIKAVPPPSARNVRVSPTVAATLKQMKHTAVMLTAIGTILNSTHHIGPTSVLFPLMGIEIGMEIIYFHSEK